MIRLKGNDEEKVSEACLNNNLIFKIGLSIMCVTGRFEEMGQEKNCERFPQNYQFPQNIYKYFRLSTNMFTYHNSLILFLLIVMITYLIYILFSFSE